MVNAARIMEAATHDIVHVLPPTIEGDDTEGGKVISQREDENADSRRDGEGSMREASKISSLTMQLRAVQKFKKLVKPRSYPMPRPVNASATGSFETPADATVYERARDATLRMLSHRFWDYFTIAFILTVVVVGAFFFFNMLGAFLINKPDPAHWWHNFSIQCLTALMTWPALSAVPWRFSNAVHLLQSRRTNTPGHDLYGRPTSAIWFHIPNRTRAYIITNLLLASVFQFINQGTRIVFNSYELSDEMPGVVWVNVFFFAGFPVTIVAARSQWKAEEALRAVDPDRFPPGAVEVLQMKLAERRAARERTRERRCARLGNKVTPTSQSELESSTSTSASGWAKSRQNLGPS